MISDGWIKYKLGDLVQVAQGLAINAKSKHLLQEKGLPLLRITDLINDTQIHFVNPIGAPKQSYATSQDIIYTRTGQVGLVFRGKEGIIHNNCFKVIPNKNLIDTSFLYWFLFQPSVRELANSIASGSVQKDLPHSAFKSIEIDIPSLEIQNKIASLLTAIDEKIRLNEQTILTLENIAQALFQEWFVNYNFPNEIGEFVSSEIGDIPKGWKVVSLSELMNFQGGSQPPSETFKDDLEEGYIRLVQIRDYETDAHATFIPFSNKLKLCSKKDIMIARYGASVGRILFGLDGAYNVALVKVIPIDNSYTEFLRVYLKSFPFQERILSISGRSAQAGFNKDDFKSFKLAIPEEKQNFTDFENIVSPFLDKILNNNEEIISLKKLRDILLPQLFKGKIEFQ